MLALLNVRIYVPTLDNDIILIIEYNTYKTDPMGEIFFHLCINYTIKTKYNSGGNEILIFYQKTV